MLARAVESIPEVEPGELWFEPKWDGFRAVVFRDGPSVEIGSRNERPLTRYFPELAGPLRARLPQRCVLDGELVVAGSDGGLDFDALSARIHPAASRIARLAADTPARFVAFDILAPGDRDLTGRPFVERRRVLAEVAAGFASPVLLTPATTDRSVAADWFERFEGAGLDGIIAKPAAEPLGLRHRGLGAAGRRAGGRGDLRRRAVGEVPSQHAPGALAARPGARELHVRPARPDPARGIGGDLRRRPAGDGLMAGGCSDGPSSGARRPPTGGVPPEPCDHPLDST